MTSEPGAPRGVPRDLSIGECLQLANAFFDRPDPRTLGLELLVREHPQAPRKMLEAGAYHMYAEAPGALLDLLARIELSLRGDEDSRGPALCGWIFHVLYHLYNWLQFEALIPAGRKGLLDLVADLKEYVKDDDKEAALATLNDIDEMLEAGESPPSVD